MIDIALSACAQAGAREARVSCSVASAIGVQIQRLFYGTSWNRCGQRRCEFGKAAGDG